MVEPLPSLTTRQAVRGAVSEFEVANAAWRTWAPGYGTQLSHGAYRRAPHIDVMGSAIRDAVIGLTPRLIITMPPRHSKSETTSHWSPTWFLDLFPELRVGLASYEATFASEWGYKVRETIKENRNRLRVRISADFGARHAWYTTQGGGMFTAGVGGPFTGRGFHLGVVDDPFKNFAEAHSQTVRDAVWNWYLSTFYTRLEPGGVLVICMTRWHEDDLVGRVIANQEEMGERWRVVNLPAIAETGDELGRAPGEALWPWRFPIERLEVIRRVLGSYLFAGLYQQHPSPAEGGIYKRAWFRYWTHAPDPRAFDEIITSWDMAFKETSDSDYVVGQVWGRIGADRYLLDQVRDRMDFPTTLRTFRQMAAKWRPRGCTVHLIEDAANGPAVVSTLQREITGLVAQPPQGSKEARAHATSAEFESGNVYVPDAAVAHWVGDYVEEMVAFPNATNDDQVDATTQALLRWGGVKGLLQGTLTDERLTGTR